MALRLLVVRRALTLVRALSHAAAHACSWAVRLAAGLARGLPRGAAGALVALRSCGVCGSCCGSRSASEAPSGLFGPIGVRTSADGDAAAARGGWGGRPWPALIAGVRTSMPLHNRRTQNLSSRPGRQIRGSWKMNQDWVDAGRIAARGGSVEDGGRAYTGGVTIQPTNSWTPDSWQGKANTQSVDYPDKPSLVAAVKQLSTLPPLVTSWEIERLRGVLGEAQQGKRFVLQGGDCAEALADCQAAKITNKLKILLQMSMVLVHGGKKPVVRIGRFAGQYSKPRSSTTETRAVDGKPVTLPSYFGDLVNQAEFTAQPPAGPAAALRGYQHAALTLNFVRSLVEGGFADIHHPEYWDLSFFQHATLGKPALREEYQRMTTNLA